MNGKDTKMSSYPRCPQDKITYEYISHVTLDFCNGQQIRCLLGAEVVHRNDDRRALWADLNPRNLYLRELEVSGLELQKQPSADWRSFV